VLFLAIQLIPNLLVFLCVLDISLIVMLQVHVKDERNPRTTADNTAYHQLSAHEPVASIPASGTDLFRATQAQLRSKYHFGS
jgi:hypothetical protein